MRIAILIGLALLTAACMESRTERADPNAADTAKWSGILIVQPDGSANICRGHFSSDPPSCGGGGIVMIEPEQLERLGKPTGSTSGVRWYDRVTVSGRVTDDGLEAAEVVRTARRSGMLIVQQDGRAKICDEVLVSLPPSCGDNGTVLIGSKELGRLGKPTGKASGVWWYERVT